MTGTHTEKSHTQTYVLKSTVGANTQKYVLFKYFEITPTPTHTHTNYGCMYPCTYIELFHF